MIDLQVSEGLMHSDAPVNPLSESKLRPPITRGNNAADLRSWGKMLDGG
jgi:hypothetical protein